MGREGLYTAPVQCTLVGLDPSSSRAPNRACCGLQSRGRSRSASDGSASRFQISTRRLSASQRNGHSGSMAAGSLGGRWRSRLTLRESSPSLCQKNVVRDAASGGGRPAGAEGPARGRAFGLARASRAWQQEGPPRIARIDSSCRRRGRPGQRRQKAPTAATKRAAAPLRRQHAAARRGSGQPFFFYK